MAWLFIGAILGVVGTLIVAAAISALSRLREHTQPLPQLLRRTVGLNRLLNVGLRWRSGPRTTDAQRSR